MCARILPNEGFRIQNFLIHPHEYCYEVVHARLEEPRWHLCHYVKEKGRGGKRKADIPHYQPLVFSVHALFSFRCVFIVSAQILTVNQYLQNLITQNSTSSVLQLKNFIMEFLFSIPPLLRHLICPSLH